MALQASSAEVQLQHLVVGSPIRLVNYTLQKNTTLLSSLILRSLVFVCAPIMLQDSHASGELTTPAVTSSSRTVAKYCAISCAVSFSRHKPLALKNDRNPSVWLAQT